MDTGFVRARSPEQREVRRERILTVTRQLLTEGRVEDLSLNEIARQVGLAKSNVLRYFGSREAILLRILQDEYGSWVEDAEAGITAGMDAGMNTDAAALILARGALGRPIMCQLLSCTATVLEHNVTVDEVIAFKLAMYAHMERLKAVLARLAGHASPSNEGGVLIALHAVVAECWAIAHPAASLVAAAERDPRIIGVPVDQGELFARTIALVLRGSAAPR